MILKWNAIRIDGDSKMINMITQRVYDALWKISTSINTVLPSRDINAVTQTHTHTHAHTHRKRKGEEERKREREH